MTLTSTPADHAPADRPSVDPASIGDRSKSALEVMLGRRSTAALHEPSPTPDQIDVLLRAATTVPDHGRLQPWRLVVITPEGRGRFGDALAEAGREANPDLSDAIAAKLRAKAFAAPMMIAVVAAIRPGKIPAWEQVASAASAGYAITLAAHALGLGAIWKSCPVTEGTELREVLAMDEADQFLGWVSLGQAPAGHTEGSSRRPAELHRLAVVAGAERTVAYDRTHLE